MVEWLQFIYAICTTDAAPEYWRELGIATNLAVALAYFWIPGVMAVVFWRWKAEIPFPWLWLAFVTFIVACGTSHVVHAQHALLETIPYSWPKLLVLVFTAAVSLATAAGFTFILPRIIRYASPAAVRDRLETAVDKATSDLKIALEHEKVLLREVHHRVKNNLQVIASLVNLQGRRLPPEASEPLAHLRERVIAMSDVYEHLREHAATLQAGALARTLGERLKSSAGGGTVELTIEGDDFEVPLDHAASLALVLNEILSTAIHRAASSRKPTIVSIATHNLAGERSIEVRGVGQPGAGPDIMADPLIRAMSRQLDATPSTVRSGPDETLYKLVFALSEGIDQKASQTGPARLDRQSP